MMDGEKYMLARMALNNAIDEFVSAARSEGFSEYSIASSILDSVYDVSEDLHRTVQHESLPMVKSFHFSKSLENEHLFKDWEKALLEWDQRQVWRALNG
ncbi:MAG TPA: hypothetical protein VFM18_17870 [Methanosarcina sp.]|nr:hypothetical protein [Methanosarcina sp.]